MSYASPLVDLHEIPKHINSTAGYIKSVSDELLDIRTKMYHYQGEPFPADVDLDRKTRYTLKAQLEVLADHIQNLYDALGLMEHDDFDLNKHAILWMMNNASNFPGLDTPRKMLDYFKEDHWAHKHLSKSELEKYMFESMKDLIMVRED